MKILGGNFGVTGSAFISRDQKLVVEGASKGIYSPEEIKSVAASVTKEKKFGIFGFLVGAILLSVILGIFFNVVGVVIAIVIAIAGSFYSESKNIVDVQFKDEKWLFDVRSGIHPMSWARMCPPQQPERRHGWYPNSNPWPGPASTLDFEESEAGYVRIAPSAGTLC